MNHQKIYDRIVEKARNENRVRLKKPNSNYVYYEKHHIIPRCLNGEDKNENLVLLTAREHFVCHKLLTYIYKGNRKITCAYTLMAFMNKRKYELSSRDYAYARELLNSTPVSEETRKKLKKIKQPIKDNTYLEFYVKKYGEEAGLKKYEKYKINTNGCHDGEKNSMFGKNHTKESLEKNRLSNLGSYEERYGKEKADEMKRKLSEKGSGENNPMAGKSIYDAWLKKGGKEYADKRLEEYKQNKRNKIWIKHLDKSKQIK
jgi:hypothetical protein